ncbi:heme NO-binding domain-containing protein [Sulfitobacter sp. JB4-11]|uniref:heme NO-binding domain-containing protein n=1 Tax=Sulfitobacter rhodophyticola TaxID=3238304 RepID=UPI003518704D
MHGLINRSIQNFVCDCYGRQCWIDVTLAAQLNFVDFEGMLKYKERLTPRVLVAMCKVLARPRGELLEDFGTYLVSHPTLEGVRRLLRFGGVDFEDFLHSLDDLPDRVRLAVPDLVLPSLELHAHNDGQFNLICETPISGYGHVMLGVLRGMADDYGTLAVLEHCGLARGRETITIQLVEPDFAEGRHFALGASVE